MCRLCWNKEGWGALSWVERVFEKCLPCLRQAEPSQAQPRPAPQQASGKSDKIQKAEDIGRKAWAPGAVSVEGNEKVNSYADLDLEVSKGMLFLMTGLLNSGNIAGVR